MMKRFCCFGMIFFTLSNAMHGPGIFATSSLFLKTLKRKPMRQEKFFLPDVAYAQVSVQELRTSLLLFRGLANQTIIEKYIEKEAERSDESSISFYDINGKIQQKLFFDVIEENTLAFAMQFLDPRIALYENGVDELLKNSIRIMDGISLSQMIAMIRNVRDERLAEGESEKSL